MTDWTARFPGLSRLAPDIRDRLHRDGRPVRFAAGETVFGPAHPHDGLLFLTNGTIRVFQTSKTGREIVLYRVEAGQSCVLTNACLLAHEDNAAEGVAETAMKAISLSKPAFDALVTEYPAFRDFIFTAYARRMNDLFHVIDEVAFGRIDIRLAARLLALAHGEREIHVTHQNLATELGTAREVISRQLHDFQKRDLIEQGRGIVTLKDGAALERLAASAT